VGHALSVLRDGLARGVEIDPEIVAALEDAAHGADRVRNIVDVLRPIAQGDHGTREVVEVASIVGGAVRASAHALRHHAQLVVEEGSTPPLLADRGQITAALVALLLGAASRVGEGRALDSVIRVRSLTDGAGRVTIEVHDDGMALGDVERARMFDPFAASGNATAGVELAVAHRTILAHGGEIDVHSSESEGTTVRVTLPAHQGGGASLRPTEHARVRAVVSASASPRRPRILVVDDEPAIGRALARLLTPEHEVEVEVDARLALKRLAEGDHFDAILCDLMMPAMSGMDLYDQLGTLDGSLRDRVVFLTGGAFTTRSEAFLRDVPNPCLSKPFSQAAVVEAVQRVSPRAASPSSPGLDAPPATTSHASEP
jgi:CheY-like chemotaxis protein